MADRHTKEARSYNMSKITAMDTLPELIVRKYLFAKGLRFRKNVASLPGKPDIVFKKYRTIVFVNGCFWHMHEGCQGFVMPKSNAAFWELKLNRNRANDIRQREELEKLGWKVITVWQCQLHKDRRSDTLESLYHNIIENI